MPQTLVIKALDSIGFRLIEEILIPGSFNLKRFDSVPVNLLRHLKASANHAHLKKVTNASDYRFAGRRITHGSWMKLVRQNIEVLAKVESSWADAHGRISLLAPYGPISSDGVHVVSADRPTTLITEADQPQIVLVHLLKKDNEGDDERVKIVYHF